MSETQFAIEFLPRLLIDPVINPIPRGENKTPDLVVEYGSKKYLIEEKEKIDNDAFISDRKDVLLRGEIHSFSVPRLPSDRIDGIFSDAVKQLTSKGAPDHDYALVWFTATGTRAEAVYEQCIATLYGTTELTSLDFTKLMTCYFYENSIFFRHSAHLDGAIVAHFSEDQLSFKLCLNPLSPRYDSLKETSFVSRFQEYNAVDDPPLQEEKGAAFILDSDVDRRLEGDKLAYLAKKYSVNHLQAMPLTYLGGTLLLPEGDS